jgi:hypothetical protein
MVGRTWTTRRPVGSDAPPGRGGGGAPGRASVAFQARFDEGPSAVVAGARCPRHGTFTMSVPLVIAPGADGCAGGTPASVDDEIRDPVIRIPKLVAEGTLRAGELVQVQVKTRHPTGPAWSTATAAGWPSRMRVIPSVSPELRLS